MVATLGPGSFIGRAMLIFGESRTADVRTKSWCRIEMLAKADLDDQHQFEATSQNKSIPRDIKKVTKKVNFIISFIFETQEVENIYSHHQAVLS